MTKEVIAEVCGVRLLRLSPLGRGHSYLALEDANFPLHAVNLRFVDEHEALAAFDRRVLAKIEILPARREDDLADMTVVAAGDDPERFKAAFYRFLESRAPPEFEAAWLKPGDPGEQPTAVLWSREAAAAFRTFLATFKLHRSRFVRPTPGHGDAAAGAG